MKYALYEGDTPPERGSLSSEFEDNYAAEQWARSWVQANAKSDRYTLERDDGRYALTVFRTNYGQWYVTPKVGNFSAETKGTAPARS